jgi:multidrug efflux system outer membrane protein
MGWLFYMVFLAQAGSAPAELTLEDLLKAALERDGRVMAAHAQLDAYRAKYDQAWWLWFPAAKLDVLFGGPVGQRRLDCTGTEDCCCKLKDPSAYSYGDLSAGVSFAVGGKLEAMLPIYTFGKISEAKNAALAGVDAGEAGIEKARQDVALEVRRAYYGWLLANASVEILEDGESKLKEAEKKLLKMLEELNEDVTDRDLFKLRYYSAQVNSMLIQARSGRQVVLEALRFLTGIEGLGREKQIKEIDLEAPAEEPGSPDDYLTKAKKLRPELKQLNAAVDAASAAVEIQKSSFFPDFYIAGYIKGSYSPAHDFIENSLLNHGYTYYDHGLTLGMRITLDIPQKMARLDESRANLRKIRAQQSQAAEAVGLEIKNRLETLRSARENLKALKKGRRAAKAWMRANFMSYGVGISNTKDLLDSLAAYAKARMELYQAHHDTLVAHDRLKAATGENLAKP